MHPVSCDCEQTRRFPHLVPVALAIVLPENAGVRQAELTHHLSSTLEEPGAGRPPFLDQGALRSPRLREGWATLVRSP
eukprot:scaffold2830_cov123-Isochrysis_galbana.AAC.17